MIKLYKKGKLKLILIEDTMFENIYKVLEKYLQEYIPLKKLKKIEQFCPKCGENLDDRFL